MVECLFFVQNIVADMRKVLAKNPQVEQQRLHRRVFLENINPENQALLVSAKHFFILMSGTSYTFVFMISYALYLLTRLP